MSELQDIERTRRALHDLEDELQDTIVGRDSLCHQLVLALAGQEHILIKGPHGEAKSMLAEKVAEATELSTFSQQIHRETRTKHIAGMLDLEKYEEDSELDLIETDFFSSHILHFDEFLRGTEEFQDLLLEIMEERRFTKSYKDSVELPVLSVIATTNPLTSGYNTGSIDEALKSRFAFVYDMDHLIKDDGLDAMEQAVSVTDEDLQIGSVDLSREDLLAFRDHAIENVEYDEELLAHFADYWHIEMVGPSVDTRFMRKFRQMIQVAHLLDGQYEPDAGLYLQVACAMFVSRFEDVRRSEVREAMDHATVRSRFSDDLREIDEITTIDDAESFVETALDKVNQIEDEYDALPEVVRDELQKLETRIEAKSMECLGDLEPSTVASMDKERFSDIQKTYINKHTTRSKKVERRGPDWDTVQDIVDTYTSDCEVEETESKGSYTSIEVRPTLYSEDSFDEVVTVRNKLKEENLLHVA